ncbi:MAG: methyltransferase domain-containing protein, partial [Roseiflexaceae bacterium]|nr:methyltransferase domain-containing protein [Roseiflexaceae bacterium]
MQLETFAWLLTPTGQRLLTTLTPETLHDNVRLATLGRLRREATAEQAAAVYETALLRVRAAMKFSRAEAMYFTREALEQSSGERITSYRCARFQSYDTVGDLCCGVGGDTIGLARVADITAVDHDELRLAMAAENARAYGVERRVQFARADLEQQPPPAAAALFFDPARRSGGRRVFSLAAYAPAISNLGVWLQRTPAIGVKIAPGASDEELATLPPHEVEFISVAGELKEAVLWFGPLGQGGRRATLLGSGAVPHTLHGTGGGLGPVADAPGAFLYEPDGAVIRAHLVAEVGGQLGAAQLDPMIAYLTSDALLATPFARCWRVLEWLPFNLKKLRARLHALDAGPVTVKKRGSPLDTDALARQLSGQGTHPLVVTLTKLRGQPVALICEGPVDDVLRVWADAKQLDLSQFTIRIY